MLFNTYEPWKFAFSKSSQSIEDVEEGAWGIVGVPFDSTTSYHGGARLGPFVVREASYGFEMYLGEDTLYFRNVTAVRYQRD